MKIRSDNRRRTKITRRQFIGGLGAGAAAAGVSTVLGPGAARARPPSPRSDRFSRMFDLPPFAEASPSLEAALREIGRPGGLLDAADALERGPVDLIVDPSLSGNNPNNPAHTAGTTFMGQFMDHDMTFDVGSALGVATKPRTATNGRTPSFDLDSVYGGGPDGEPPAVRGRQGPAAGRVGRPIRGPSPHLRQHRHHRRPSKRRARDHRRAACGVPAVPQPGRRGSEGLRHLAPHGPVRGGTTDHHLALPVDRPARGPAAVRRAGGARRHPRERLALLPSPDRRGIDPGGVPRSGVPVRALHGPPVLSPEPRRQRRGAVLRDDLRPLAGGVARSGRPSGRGKAPRRFVGWQTFFDFADGQVKPNKRIDTKISTPLFSLPLGAIASHDQPTALPQRNLLRNLTWELPSGQAIAEYVGAPVLSRRDLAELRDFGLGLDRRTPLWYYALKEAEVVQDGLRLGPVGGRIVAEVIIGLLRADPASYLSVDPRWRPTLPTRPGAVTGEFRMVDFLTFAGVDPTSRGQ